MNFPSKFILLLNTSSSNQDVSIQIVLYASKFFFLIFCWQIAWKINLNVWALPPPTPLTISKRNYNSLHHVPNLPIPMCPCSLEHLRHRRANGGVVHVLSNDGYPFIPLSGAHWYHDDVLPGSIIRFHVHHLPNLCSHQRPLRPPPSFVSEVQAWY